jgi:hypothetical protein
VIPVLLYAATAAVLAWLFVGFFQSYPFYFIWDMDAIVVQDTILLNSGYPPDQILHPGAGMYLVLANSGRGAKRAGIVSTTTLGDLGGALSPLNGVAELTDYFRSHSPVIAMAILFLGWAAVVRLTRAPPLPGFFVLIVLGCRPSLFYHSTMVRSELYAVVLWCIAIAAIAVLWHRPSRRWHGALLVLSGLLLGLAFLTKVQIVLHVATACLLALGARWSNGPRLAEPQVVSEARTRRGAAFAGAALLAMLVLSILAWKTEIPPNVPTWTDTFSMTPQLAGALLALAGLVVVQLLPGRPKLRTTASDLSMLAAGGVAAIFLTLAATPSLATGWVYLLRVFKMVFLRQPGGEAIFSRSPGDLIEIVAARPLVFAAFAVVCVVLVALLRRRQAGSGHIVLCAALCAFALAEVVLTVRPIQRDMLLIDTLMVPVILAVALVAARRLLFIGRAALLLAVCTLLLVDGAAGGSKVVRDLDVLYADYGWRPTYWIFAAYPGEQARFEETMFRAYGHLEDRTQRWWLPPPVIFRAVHHKPTRRTASAVVPSREINHRYIGILWEGLPAWTDRPKMRFTSIPETLRGAVTVDCAAAPDMRRGFRPAGDPPAEWIRSSPQDEPAPGALALLPRSDLSVHLFVSEGDYLSAIGRIGATKLPDPPRIVVSDGTVNHVLHGVALSSYHTLEPNALHGPYLLVVEAPAML